jgi:hypothetical protein
VILKFKILRQLRRYLLNLIGIAYSQQFSVLDLQNQIHLQNLHSTNCPHELQTLVFHCTDIDSLHLLTNKDPIQQFGMDWEREGRNDLVLNPHNQLENKYYLFYLVHN